MVKQVRVPENESWRSERASKLKKIVLDTLGDDFNVDLAGKHLRVRYTDSPAGAAEPNMDVYLESNTIDVYTPDIFGWGFQLAEAFEKAGESEFTVRGNYSKRTAENYHLKPGQVSV